MKRLWIAAIALLCAAMVCAEFRLAQPEKIVLKNGMTVLYRYEAQLPLVSFHLLLNGAGSVGENQEGLADLTAALLSKGAAGRSAEAIAEELDFLGANLGFGADREFMSVNGGALAENFPRILEIAADCLLRPTFPPEELEKERQLRLDNIKSIKDDPREAVMFYFTKAFFGRHPLGNLSIGNESSLAAVNADSVRAFYRAHYRPERVILSVVGAVEKKKLLALLEAGFGRWSVNTAAAPVPTLPPFTPSAAPVRILIDKPDATQAYFIMGGAGLALGDEATAAAEVMNTLFGGRFTSWLNTELRIKRGLTYGAQSMLDKWSNGGGFFVTSYTRNEKIGEMLDIAFELIAKGREKGFSAEELQSSRNYILGQFPATLETLGSQARLYSEALFYKLGFDYYSLLLQKVQSIGAEEAHAAARRLLPAPCPVLVVVGKAEEIRAQLAKFGPFVEKKITDVGF